MGGLEERDRDSDFAIHFDCGDYKIAELESSMSARETYNKLASDNIRIFAVRLNNDSKRELTHWIHHNKTVSQWRDDMRQFVLSSSRSDDEGWACSEVWNGLFSHLQKLGYHEVNDVVADVYEGRITNNAARLVDDPDHEEQSDGFGHYGWGSK